MVCLIFLSETFLFTFLQNCTSWVPGSVPSLPHLSGHHIYKVYRVCLQTGNGKYSFRFYPRGFLVESKNNRLNVYLDLDQGNFLCLIDWKFHFLFLLKDLLD